jgi:hypothetical protein
MVALGRPFPGKVITQLKTARLESEASVSGALKFPQSFAMFRMCILAFW